MREVDWQVLRPLGEPPGHRTAWIVGAYTDRHDLRVRVVVPVPRELVDDPRFRDPEGRLLTWAWDEFRWHRDRRFDDPFAFWPPLEPGRWAA